MSPNPKPNLTPSGAAMDRPLPARRRWPRPLRLAAWVAVALGGLALLAWQRVPQLPAAHAAQLAPVRAGEFRDELPLRARVEPLRSVQLDAAEAGRVEVVLAQDGDWLEAGAPLYRLHSPEQEQLLMQRSAEVAQQMANVSVQRSAQAASLAANRRELAQLQAAEAQAEAERQRQTQLAAAGFVSSAALEQTERQQRLATQLLQQARVDQRLEADTRQQSIDEMARAVQGLQRGLQLLERSRERLQQRAPIAGQLSGFQLQVGTSVRPGDRLGRIDDPAGGMQLVADVDEYYLPRLQVGQRATSASGTLSLAQTLPQVQGGKARLLLRWPAAGAPGDLRPGQAVELRLQLSQPTPALLLPEGPGVQVQLYVKEGTELRRRRVQLGRRAAGQVEVLAGLQVGEQVLISQPPSDAERLALP
ncbi:efflux RND transporter periplasmic adaptor subunit [Roseateles toxinivorans]|uniref:HlyD family secretion protein n=1 Tax=Roseateles toxinivorans TaxID=270368 RepID=A0A4R6QH54_9BURK|nr:HlyD family efflux transporter periplasmic adaptor subunit [Roseateles toxinivorans]TDP61686.1 HlyD family secretion protein [Roseateles toxinivorans]